MRKLLCLLLALTIINCTTDDELPSAEFMQELEEVDPTIFNPDLTVLQNLENGVPVLDIKNEVGVQPFYGIEYGGGFIFHVDITDGTLMIATDYSVLGPKSWGDHFDFSNSNLIGDGLINTQFIVDGNLNDNSNVPNGLEFGNDDYVFKIVTDLEYNDYDDWFVPSSGSMEAIYDNLHSQGLGNFDETLFYWTSTKVGYEPYVMSFNGNFFGGDCFLGTCFGSNAVVIARKM